jgi:hypothetical protein
VVMAICGGVMTPPHLPPTTANPRAKIKQRDFKNKGDNLQHFVNMGMVQPVWDNEQIMVWKE